MLILATLLMWLYSKPVRTQALPSPFPEYEITKNVLFARQSVVTNGFEKRTTNVQIVDFDRDSKPDLIVCDAARNSVLWYRQLDGQKWAENVLAADLNVPAHATVVDLDQDGDLDVVVSILGDIYPSDEVIGKVVWLENQNGQFAKRTLLEDVRRVADVQPGDFDRDGDTDLVVAVFGYARGEVLWLENRGGGQFRDHVLLSRPGTIHVPVGDLDGDGDLDITTIVTQDEEELWAFENDGRGNFKPRRLEYSDNYDIGGAGLVLVDLDKDGDLDFLIPQGDNLEDRDTWPQPYHGCLYVENLGGWKFRSRNIAQLGCTYAAAASDMDGDGDLDVTLVSMSNDWGNFGHPAVVWLENDGRQNFKTWKIDIHPLRLVTVAAGDLDGDGRAEIVAGSLHLPPFDATHADSISVWWNRKEQP